MNIVYTLEELPETINKSIFLAGPTSREGGESSWRKDAIKILEDKGFDGTIFVPEARDWKKFDPEYDEQVEWEERCLNVADCIVFWIPRDLKTLPGFTTNDEWGAWKYSGKTVLGYPKDAEKVKYQEYYANKLNIPLCDSLMETMQEAIDFLGFGYKRTEGERFVPLYIWNTPSFQSWYKSQTESGNSLKWAQVLFNFRPQNKNFVFLWILKAHIYVKSEDRIKENEFVLARPDVSSVVMWYKNEYNLNKSRIVLIKEFRTPASTKDGFIRELPGGSSKKDRNPILVAVEEIEEETGFSLHPSRIKSHSSRQLAGTLSSHKSNLYSVELNEEEIEWFSNKKETYGNKEDTEITYVEVISVEDIFKLDIDWSNVGQILSVIYNIEN